MSGVHRPFAQVMRRPPRLASLCSSLAGALLVASPIAWAAPSLGGEDGMGYSWDTTELSGQLVSRTRHAVTLRDPAGTVHTLKLTDRTRFVWTERSGPEDLAPGAKIRAELDADAQRVVLALWVLEGPR